LIHWRVKRDLISVKRDLIQVSTGVPSNLSWREQLGTRHDDDDARPLL